MNLSSMSMSNLKKLKREIEDEICKRSEKESRELRDLLKDYLRTTQAIYGKREKGAPFPDAYLIGTKELAAILGVSVSQVYRMSEAGSLPVIRVGRRYRYNYQEVIELLKQGG